MADVRFYGQLIKMGSRNTVDPVKRGNVFWVENSKNEGIQTNDKGMHPYLIIQNMYRSIDQCIGCFIIDSKPYMLNVLPIVLNNRISYLDPNRIHYIPIAELKAQYYIGTMDNALVDLSMSLFSKMVGMQINKTEEEINQSYMDYLDNFYKINGDLLNLSNKLHDLRLHISFEPYKYGKKYIPSFLVNKIETVVSPVEKLAPVSEKKNTKCNSGKSLTEVVVKAPEPKPVNANLVIIDMNDDKIQTDAIRIIDNPRRITMRKRIDDMEIDLIKAFFYIIYEESISYMAKLLGLNYTTLFNRIKVYKTSHRVVYKNAQNLI